MSIIGLHVPHGEVQLAAVSINERNAMSNYPYVQGGPVEGAHFALGEVDLVMYVNSRYGQLEEALINPRASALFELAGIGMLGGTVRGDALLVRGAGRGAYERSLPPELISMLMDADSAT